MVKRKNRAVPVSRAPFQGVWNVVRFNWHMYLAAVLLPILLITVAAYVPTAVGVLLCAAAYITLASVALSLGVSFYVYDVSDLYTLPWIDLEEDMVVLHAHAGFDEISDIIAKQYPRAQLYVGDFYDAQQCTEISIRRARNYYPSFTGTQTVSAKVLPYPDARFDCILVFFSAHEIRVPSDQQLFFQELRRVMKPKGKIYLTEHLFDVWNSIAYTLGVGHFYSRKHWQTVCTKAGLSISNEIKTTPWVTTFELRSDGTTA